jgi:hypothetical protein
LLTAYRHRTYETQLTMADSKKDDVLLKGRNLNES